MAAQKSNLARPYDALIAGAGLAGLAMAARLGHAGLNVAIIERQPREVFAKPTHDGRTTAIAYGCRGILEECGVWPKLEPHTSPISDIVVADQHARPKIDFEAPEGAPFGFIIDNLYFRQGLFERIAELPNITLIDGRAITALNNGPDEIAVMLDNGEELSAPLLIAADGRNSTCRQLAGIKTHGWSYNQSALVCTIRHAKPHNGLAIENFYPAGPFAMLPMSENRSSIVWTESPETAEALLNMPEDEFLQRLIERGGAHVGKIELASKRMLYPLTFMLADELYKGRLVLIGEAAHAMHPIAGQGLNLSLRDVATLANLIVAGGRVDFANYSAARHLDHFTFMMATDVLEKMFSNNIAPLKWARQFGLGVVNRLPFAKRFFSRMAMGLLN